MSARLRITDLLHAADRYLDGDRSTAADAPFSAALLAREALESAISQWGRKALALELSMVGGRAQLAVLQEHVGDAALARRARYAWNTLSALLHHGPGAADPATVRWLVGEVKRSVAGLANEVSARAATPS